MVAGPARWRWPPGTRFEGPSRDAPPPPRPARAAPAPSPSRTACRRPRAPRTLAQLSAAFRRRHQRARRGAQARGARGERAWCAAGARAARRRRLGPTDCERAQGLPERARAEERRRGGLAHLEGAQPRACPSPRRRRAPRTRLKATIATAGSKAKAHAPHGGVPALQHALGLSADGVFGPKTARAAQALPAPSRPDRRRSCRPRHPLGPRHRQRSHAPPASPAFPTPPLRSAQTGPPGAIGGDDRRRQPDRRAPLYLGRRPRLVRRGRLRLLRLGVLRAPRRPGCSPRRWTRARSRATAFRAPANTSRSTPTPATPG